jgi:hypothetical protein
LTDRDFYNVIVSRKYDIELRCRRCGYDLHGLPMSHSDVLRCPECGDLASILSIAQEHDRRRRGDLEMLAALGIGIFAGVALVHPVGMVVAAALLAAAGFQFLINLIGLHRSF